MFGMRIAMIAAASAVALAAGGTAHAGSLLTETFDGENGGSSALNYTGFANWTVSSGTVDIIHHGDYGISCYGGAGSCVDLDGSTDQGGVLLTAKSYAFNAGDTVVFSAQISGNQRGSADDGFYMGFNFDASTHIASYNTGGGYGAATVFSDVYGYGFSSSGPMLASNDPFRFYSISFLAAQAGTVQAYIGTLSSDDYGPIVDNVSLGGPGGAPEPASWALMILGCGAAGVMLRKAHKLALS